MECSAPQYNVTITDYAYLTSDINTKTWQMKGIFSTAVQCNKYRLCLFDMERKGNVSFNDALNTFYLRLYGSRTYGTSHIGYSF